MSSNSGSQLAIASKSFVREGRPTRDGPSEALPRWRAVL